MSVLVTIFGSVAATLAAAEFRAWSPRASRAILRMASRLTAQDMQDRMFEEWSAHLEDTPGDVGRLLLALGFVLASVRVVSPVTGLSRLDAIGVAIRRLALGWRRAPDETERDRRTTSYVAFVLLLILMVASGGHRVLSNSAENIADHGGGKEDWTVVAAFILAIAVFVYGQRQSIARERREAEVDW